MFENSEMPKRTIVVVFKVAVGFAIAGAVSGVAVVIAALIGGAITFGGPQLVSIQPGPFATGVIGLGVASTLVGVRAALAIASWVMALINTSQLEDRTWFAALLVLGLVSLGWVAMIAYVLRGPDSTTSAARTGSPASTAA